MRTLKYGATGEDVRTLQTALKRAGSNIQIDGAFGAATTTAVKEFQKKHGLIADGIVGSATWAALRPVDYAAIGKAVSSCVDAIEKLPEFKELRKMLNG